MCKQRSTFIDDNNFLTMQFDCNNCFKVFCNNIHSKVVVPSVSYTCSVCVCVCVCVFCLPLPIMLWVRLYPGLGV